MRSIEAPYLDQKSPGSDNALEKTLKETEGKLKASEEEIERLSLRIKSLMKERNEEVGKMMDFNYRLLTQLDYLRDDHASLKKAVTASNKKFENKLAHYKSKASTQEKKINKNEESAVSITDELFEKSASTAETVKNLAKDVKVLVKWRSEVKLAELELQAKQAEHELRAKNAERELQAKKAESELLWGEAYDSPRSPCVEAMWEGSCISPCDRRGEANGGWRSAILTRDRRGEAYGEQGSAVSARNQWDALRYGGRW